MDGEVENRTNRTNKIEDMNKFFRILDVLMLKLSVVLLTVNDYENSNDEEIM